MPVHIIAAGFFNGLDSIPYAISILRVLPWLLGIAALKYYFGGARNTSERLMHSKVIMMTGGTSGIGATVAHDLASRGAQIILLTQHAPSDAFLVDYIEDLRTSSKNELVYAEQVDLASLHSIRRFATKWVDNAPPRRLDMIILCADTFTPRLGAQVLTAEGVESTWGINYLANFHLLSILSPALRAQPADRDVRVIFGTCSSYMGGDLTLLKDSVDPLPKKQPHGTSKLALMVFAHAFQSHLNAYKRPDKQPNNTRVIMVDPGFSRTPGTRRWLTMGSLWGLLCYLATWPLWWLILKSPEQGGQTFLRAAMEASLGTGAGARFLKECRERPLLRKEIEDEAVAKSLWDYSEKQIMALERQGAIQRTADKKSEKLKQGKVAKEDSRDADLPRKKR